MSEKKGIRRLGLVACAVASIFVVACSKDQSADHLAKAKELAAKNDHRGAIIELKNTLQTNQQSGEARFLLGRELLEQNDAKNASIELQKALDLKYDPEQVLPLMVKADMLQGNLDNVVKTVRNAQLKSPAANAELQGLLGVAYFGLGRADEALTAFATARKYVPDYPAAILGEARIKAARGDFAGSTVQVNQLLTKDPTQAEALLLKGDIARAQGLPKEAVASYEAAIKENPRNFMARLSLASALMGDNQLEPAQKQVDELKKLSPRHPGVNYLDGLIAFRKNDYNRANDAVTLSLSSMPTNGAAQLLSGAINVALNQPSQAEQHLRDAVKSMPTNLYARKLLSSLYLRQRQPLKAEEVLQPAMASAPSDPSLIGLAGEIALQKGDFNGASRMFEQAAKLNPNDANLRTQSAAVMFARGNEGAGFAELEAASKASANNNPNPDIALILAHVQRKHYDQALVAWKGLEKRQPDSPVTYNLKASIDLGRNDLPAARAALEKAVALQPSYFPAVANLANLDIRDKNIEGARKRYKELLAKDPGNLAGLLAYAQFENAYGGTSETVLGLLKEAKRTNPNSELASTAIIGYYNSKGDPKQALAAAQDALASSPDNPRYLELAGTLLLQTGAADQAIALYRKLIGINPEAVDYQIRLGQAQLMAGQSEVALQTFANTIKQRPNSLEAQTAMVASMLRSGKVEEAQRLLTQIKDTAPKSPAIPELEGDVKFAQKQFGDAAASYKRVLAEAPTPNLVVKIYSALSLGNKKADADAFIADWLKTHPKDVAVRMFDADIAMRTKDYPRASQGYKALLAAKPDDPVLLNNLAWSLWEQKDAQALGYAEKAAQLAPNSPAVGDTLGWMLVEQGQVKRGLELLEKASAMVPKQSEIALHLAKAQIKDGKKDAARTTLQNVMKNAPADSAEAKESKALLASL